MPPKYDSKPIGGDFMGGSVHHDKKSNRWFISIYWESKRYKIFKHPVTQEPFWAKKSAEKQLNKIRTEIDEGYFNPAAWFPDSPLSIRLYCDEWLEGADVTKRTLGDYRGYCKNYIIKYFKDKDIRTVRHSDLLKFKKWLGEIGRSEKTIYNVVSAFRTMMNYAWKDEVISSVPPFPALPFKLPTVEYLTMEQQDKVLAEIPEKHRPIYAFMMDNGTRVGEALALQKDCIKEDCIEIKRTFSGNTLKLCSDNKKGGVIGMTDYTRDVLAGIPQHLGPFIFVRDDGKPYTNKNLNAIWREACGKVEIKIKLYNAVRHSLGCQLLDQGEDIDLVRQQLRHTNIKMTERYAERSNKTVTAALNRRRSKIVDFPKKTTK
ncbi:MAG: tyrosine-type recombinase/integrase [Desulfobacterium sp.]|nr:tyrosine-type recombinase/integrase [Desulfobacterium sp.]